MPHMSSEDPQYGIWYDRYDEVLFEYMRRQGIEFDKGKGIHQAVRELGQAQNLNPEDLIGSEPYVSPSGSAKPNDPIIVASIDGKLFIIDGNHRAVDAFNNKRPVPALVIDVDALEQQLAA